MPEDAARVMQVDDLSDIKGPAIVTVILSAGKSDSNGARLVATATGYVGTKKVAQATAVNLGGVDPSASTQTMTFAVPLGPNGRVVIEDQSGGTAEVYRTDLFGVS